MIKFLMTADVRGVSLSENINYTGYDIGIFQKWNIKEHGPKNLDVTSPKLYNLMKKQLLIHSSYMEESPEEGLDNFNWYDINSLNSLRNDSSFIKENPDCSDNSYSLRIGLVYKFILNDVCVCVDSTRQIINLQRIWRRYWRHVTNPKTILSRQITGRKY